MEQKCKHNWMDEFSRKFSNDGEHIFFYYLCNECEQHFQRDSYRLSYKSIKMITSEDISESEFEELA